MHNIVSFFLKCLLSVLREGKSLKDMLVREKVPVEKERGGKSCGCEGKRSEVCTFLEEKNTFPNKKGSNTYKIREGLHLDCNSKKCDIICLITLMKMKM